jgi:glycosyltransferase involved in cell wall biosynthesis
VRVLIAHSFYRLAGGEDRYVRQQTELLSHDHEVELFSRRNDELPGGVSSVLTMTLSEKRIREAVDVIEAFRPDVIHVHNVYPALGPAVHLAAKRRRVPVVMTVHNFRLRCPNGYMFTEGAPCERCIPGNYTNAIVHRCFPERSQAVAYAGSLWTHRFVLRLEKTVSMYIAPSEFMRARLRSWGFDEERIRLVRNFTDVKAMAASPPGSFGMYLGRLSSEKGLEVLLRALRQAGDPPFRIVGDGPLESGLAELAADLGLERCLFLGRKTPDEVTSLLKECRFLAMPSLCHENSPLAALEALTVGRPLLTSTMGGLPELVGQDRGLTFQSGDISDAADKITLFMGDEALCKTTGAAAAEFAATELSPGRHQAGIEDAYAGAASLALPYSA